MSSRFGKGEKNGSGRYRELAQQDSESELSLSDEEKVVFKKPGSVKLNLYPERKIIRTKAKPTCCQYAGICVAVTVLLVAVTVVAAVYVKSHRHFIGSGNLPASKTPSKVLATHCKDEEGCWSLENTASEGAVRLIDVDRDGKDDIVFAHADSAIVALNGQYGQKNMTNFKGLHDACKRIGREYPCFGRLTALRGFDGKQLWSINTRSGAFEMNCEEFDINMDGKMDCIATGRQAVTVAFDPYKGEVLWRCEDDTFLNASWNTYQAARLPDWNGDGVPEVLIANGGDLTREPKDHNRVSGRLLVLSGKTGEPMGHRYLNMPHSKETYMSPIVYTPGKEKPTYILFGSGGETVPGDLMGISLRDFCLFIFGTDSEKCLKEKETHYKNLATDDNMKEILIIYKGSRKGVMVPPVIADVNNDGTLDILMTTFEGKNILYNGENLSALWTAELAVVTPGNVTSMETYSTPSPGYFDDDEYLDFMIHWNQGEWMSYSNVSTVILSGKDGSVIWRLYSNYMDMSSPLSLLSADKKHSTYLFMVIARESIFRWTKEGVVKNYKSKTGRKRRHTEELSGPEPFDSVEARKERFKAMINCDDDLSTYTEEMFVIDKGSLKNLSLILQVPIEKHSYDANATCSAPTQGMGPSPGGNSNQPQSADDNKPSPSKGDDNFQSSEGDQQSSDENQQGLNRQESTMTSDNKGQVQEGKQTDKKGNDNDIDASGADRTGTDESDDNAKIDSSEGVDDNQSVSDNSTNSKTTSRLKKMCSVETPDGMSSGAVGDVDGDGLLDYISLLSLHLQKYDAEYCEQGSAVRVVIHKVSLEKGLLAGSFPHIPVKAENSLQSVDDGKNKDGRKRLFAPASEQKWTHYMGAKENNHFG